MAVDNPTIVLVHGAWADATGFEPQIRALQERGYSAIGFGNPLRDLAGDSALAGAMGRPDLIAKIRPYGAGFLPIPSIACATASLKAKSLVAERRALNRRIRENTFEFLHKKGVGYIPSGPTSS